MLLRGVGQLLAKRERQLTALGVVIGVVTGFGALGFSFLVENVTEFYYAYVGGELQARGLYYWLLPLLPMSGALLVGLITYFFAPEAGGHGVPEVMDAMARKGGRIRPRVAGAKAVASALTIGSGGAAGTEGPIIQIGAAIGSGVGQWLRLSLDDMRVLIGCGAAAGIAAIFNAPIAGVLFAVEILLREVSQRSFVPVILAAVLSNVITHAFGQDNVAVFPAPVKITGAPAYEFAVSEFGNYLVLGLLCGVIAVGLVKLLYFSEDAFRKIPVHRILMPVVGAAMLGLLALGSHWLVGASTPLGEGAGHPPPIMGNGYPTIKMVLGVDGYMGPSAWTAQVLLVLLVAKALATCLTLGSGGSGGVFAPSLFIGATFGGAFGVLIKQIPLFADVNPGAYALVGMAAVVSSSIHAPMTATLMLFELTGNYKVIIPIMIAVVAGLFVAQWMETASIYTLKLLRRGVQFGVGDVRLQRISVRDVPRVRAPIVSPNDPVDKLVRTMRTSTANDFVVLDNEGRFAGMVLGDDLRTLLLESEAMPLLLVSDIVRSGIPSVNPDETLDRVLDKFAGRPMQSLPVFDSTHEGGKWELITRAAVMTRYHQSTVGADGSGA